MASLDPCAPSPEPSTHRQSAICNGVGALPPFRIARLPPAPGTPRPPIRSAHCRIPHGSQARSPALRSGPGRWSLLGRQCPLPFGARHGVPLCLRLPPANVRIAARVARLLSCCPSAVPRAPSRLSVCPSTVAGHACIQTKAGPVREGWVGIPSPSLLVTTPSHIRAPCRDLASRGIRPAGRRAS
jgi:hypothetical protein